MLFLSALGLELPAPFPPAASYRSVRVHGDVAYVSGHGPMRDGAAVYRGKLGADVDVETGKLSAQLTALNILASLLSYYDFHDHDFSFLTTNFFGPGYATDLFSYSYEDVVGEV